MPSSLTCDKCGHHTVYSRLKTKDCVCRTCGNIFVPEGAGNPQSLRVRWEGEDDRPRVSPTLHAILRNQPVLKKPLTPHKFYSQRGLKGLVIYVDPHVHQELVLEAREVGRSLQKAIRTILECHTLNAKRRRGGPVLGL